MENNATHLETLFVKAEEYSKTTIKLLKLQAVDKTVDIISFFVIRLVLFITVALFIIILSIGASFWIGELLGKFYYGFLVVGGLYGLAAIVLYFSRQQLVRPVSDSIIVQIIKQKII